MNTQEPFELERGTGNVYADLGFVNAELIQIKASIDAGDYSRVRRARFERLSVDRLLRMTERLGRHPTIKFTATAKVSEVRVHA